MFANVLNGIMQFVHASLL